MSTFISFSSKNRESAEKIRDILEENGIKTWMCDHSITIGEDYTKKIGPAIRNSDHFILLLSKEAEESVYVYRELAIAIENLGDRIFPISFGYTAQSESFDFLLKTIQVKTITEISENDSILSEIIKTIKKYTINNSSEAQPQKINIINLSSLDNSRYLYLGSDRLQFTADTDGYFLYDKIDKNLLFVHLPDFNILGHVKCDGSLIIDEYLSCSPDGNYLLLLKDSKIWIADLLSHKWIIKKKSLNNKKDERILYIAWSKTNNIFFYSGKNIKNRPRVTQINTVCPAPFKDDMADLSSLNLCENIGTRKYDKAYWSIFRTVNDELIAFNPDKLLYSNDYLKILSSSKSDFYLNDNGIDQFALDNSTYYYSQNIGNNTYLNICDTKENEVLLQMPSSVVGGITLLEDYKAAIYDKSCGRMYIYNLKTKSQSTLIREDYFLNSEVFFGNTPESAIIDPITNTLVFPVYNKASESFRLVAVKYGKIIAISDEFNQRFKKQWLSSNIDEYANGFIFGMFVTPGMSEHKSNGINTYLYYAAFRRENGELIFE